MYGATRRPLGVPIGSGRHIAITAMAMAAICMVSGAVAGTDDRISASVSGSTLTGTDGGAGESVGWLHNFDPATVAGLGVEHQQIASAEWGLISLDGSISWGADSTRYNLYGDAREGAGDDGSRAFHYSVETAGLITTFQHSLSVQLEDKQIDVETTHGNLPKLGVSYLWDRSVYASIGYAYSLGGNLGTRLWTGSLQSFALKWRPLFGVAVGQAAPAILNLEPGIIPPSRILKEGYVGASMPRRMLGGDWSLVADFLTLGGIHRATLTASYTYHPGRQPASPPPP
jgi:hypothetical protein